MDTIDEVRKNIAELKQKINDLDVKITRIVDWIEQDGTKMSDHIVFVENVYEKVRKPFNFIMDNVTHVLNHKNPFIEYETYAEV